MAIEVMVWVLEQDRNITTNEKFVLLGIANHSRPDGTNAFPSLDTLARYTLLSRSTVQRCIKELLSKGFLTYEPGGGRKSNTYIVTMNYAKVTRLEVLEGGHTDPITEDASTGEQGHPDQGAGSDFDQAAGSRLDLAAGSGFDQGTVIEPLSTEIESRARKLGVRKRDEVWDAIMEACGVNTATINSNERGRYNKAVKLLKESGATGAQIHTRVQVYRRKFKGASVTPVAIANHWSELDPATVKVEDVVSAPKGWDAIRQAREARDGQHQT
jgi:hypothetical protein